MFRHARAGAAPSVRSTLQAGGRATVLVFFLCAGSRGGLGFSFSATVFLLGLRRFTWKDFSFLLVSLWLL
jgi:hypothetical protein